MTASKKDFDVLAEVLRVSRPDGDAPERQTWERIVGDYAAMLPRLNARFDRQRWYDACYGRDSQDSAGRKVRYGDNEQDGSQDPSWKNL